jgi:hypothetical protein
MSASPETDEADAGRSTLTGLPPSRTRNLWLHTGYEAEIPRILPPQLVSSPGVQ